jgi:hypothetical protein
MNEQRQRGRQVLVVTGKQHIDVIDQVLATANLNRYVDVLTIEQWFVILTYRTGSCQNAMRREALGELIATYNRIAGSLTQIEMPRLVPG